ncbi:MAG: hypothetical protein MK135_09825 [Polyangiaceae bacterium]|nr:hypothetical protein [Polyangiaceae bacterium]
MKQSRKIASPTNRLLAGLCSVLGLSSLIFSTGCGREEPKYEPKPAVTDVTVNLPAVPSLPERKEKDGDAYTVWGASYAMRNRVHKKDVLDKKVSIVGYITKTNLEDAPRCAVHKTGKADDEDCIAPVPTFWIGDSVDAKPEETMKVMGFASNFAQIYDAIKEFDKHGDEGEYMDGTWGNPLPNPLPIAGAKVKVTGVYSTTFNKASDGAAADPLMGILDYQEVEYLEPAEEFATLPGMRRRRKK